MHQRTIISGTVAAMAAALIVPIMTGPANAAEGPPLLITGQLVRADVPVEAGKIVASRARNVASLRNARVVLVYLPLTDAKAGDEIKPLILGEAITDSGGKYRIALDPSPEIVAAAQSNNGWVNFDLVSNAGQDVKVEGFSRRWSAGTWGGSSREGMNPAHSQQTLIARDAISGKSLQGSTVATENANLPRRPMEGSGLSAAEIPQSIDATSAGSALAATTEIDGTAVIQSVAPCSFIVTARPLKATRILEWHSSADADGRWEYGATADSDVGVGWDYNGNGGWFVSGTQHVSNSLGAKVYGTSTTLIGTYKTSNFTYTEGYYKPYGLGTTCSGTSIPVNTKTTRVTTWQGGTGSSGDVSSQNCLSAPQSSYSLRYERYTGFTKNTSRARSISAAATFSYGLSLSGTSGYSTNVDMSWYWARNWGYICGNNAYPSSAQVIYTY